MRKILFIIILFLSCIALCFTGCAGSNEKAPGSSTTKNSSQSVKTSPGVQIISSAEIIEPEQLITRQEAELLLGEAVKECEKKEQKAVGQKIGVYKQKDGDSLYFLQISITQKTFMKNDSQTPESIYKATKEAVAEAGEQRSIDGVGDEYFFGTPGLHILKHGYYICIAAGNADDDKVRQVLEQAGALAVKNLEKALNK